MTLEFKWEDRSHFTGHPALSTLTYACSKELADLPWMSSRKQTHCKGLNTEGSDSYHIWVIPTPWSCSTNNCLLVRRCPVQNTLYTLPRVINVSRISPVIAVLSDFCIIGLRKQSSLFHLFSTNILLKVKIVKFKGSACNLFRLQLKISRKRAKSLLGWNFTVRSLLQKQAM